MDTVKVALEGAVATGQVGNLDVEMRSYFSSYHLWAARHFAKLAQEIEDTHSGKLRFDVRHRAYVMGAIVSAAAFLEAVVNEVFDDAADGHPGYVDALSSEARLELSNLWSEKCTEAKRWAPLEKFQAALRCCSTEVFNKGALPYQDAKLLMNLRNELVHARPETVSSSDKDQSQRRGQMNSKFRPNRLMENSGNAYFPDHCLGAGCAAWAVKSARAFADDFFARTKIKPNYQRVDFGPE